MRIPQTNVVIEFELAEDLLLTIGSDLKEFQKKTNSKLQVLNIPVNIPPEAPRAVISTQNALINIGLNRFEIISRIPKHIVDNYQSTINFTKNIVLDVYSALWNKELVYTWTGIVATIEYPLESDEKTALVISKPFFDKLINIDRNNRELASFQVKAGFQEGKFFKNYNISCFETYNLSFDPSKVPIGTKYFDIEEYGEITDVGLRIVMDINNKRGEKSKDFPPDFEILTKEFGTSFQSLTKDLNIDKLV